MKYDYLISYYYSFPSFFTDDGEYVEVTGGAGWYILVSDHPPLGPFQTQGEVIEALSLEWEKFEESYADSMEA